MMAYRYRRVKWCAGCLPLLMVCLLVFSNARGQRFSFHNIGADEGLASGQATCLAQDKNGMLWVGTLGGLSRYDGRNITNYTTGNGLLSNTIRAVAADEAGNLWIGTPNGLTQYNGKSFVHFTLPTPAEKGGNTTQQIQVRHDTTWWRVQGDVYYIVNGEIKEYATPGPTGFVTAILADNGGMWLAKDGTVYHNNNGKWEAVTLAAQEGNDKRPEVFRIIRDRKNRVWLGTDMALYRVQGQQGVINTQPSFFYPPLSSIAQDNAGSLWITTGSGVIKVDGNTMQQFNKKNGLSDLAFTDVMMDAEGNIWMASDGQGIFRFSGTPFTMLDESMGLPNTRITAFAYRDSLYFGTTGGGIYTFKNVISQIQFPTQLASSISAIIVGKHSKYWIATRGSGLWSYDGNVFKQYAAPEHHFLSNYITNVYEDAAARLWISFPNGVIVRENDTFKVLSNLTASYVMRDLPDGRVLVGTDKGLMQYANGEYTPYSTNSALDTSSVRSFVLDGTVIWAACNRTGVVRFDMNTNKALVINGSKGLKAEAVFNIAVDREGNAWAGTGVGVYKIHAGEGNDVQVTLYGSAQGVGAVESGANAMVRLPDSSIWFGTSNGAVHYVGERQEGANGGKVRLIMQLVKLKGEPVIDSQWYESLDAWYDVPNGLKLPTLKNSLSFAFQGVTLSGTEKLVYRYRLEGSDEKWSEWSDNTTASYNGLPPGKYTLHVQTRSADGRYTGDLKYPFEIITPMILTNWFKYAALLTAVLIGILLQYFVSVRRAVGRRRAERMRTAEMAMVRFRTEEDFHDQLGNQLTKISVLTNVLKNKVPNSPDTVKVLNQIKENTDRLYDDARDILWLQKDENGNLYEVLQFIREYGETLFRGTDVNFLFSKVDEKWVNRRLPLDVSHNVVMIFKEALLNCRKHAKASNVSIEVTLRRKNILQFIMRDDGRGFDIQAERYSMGIVSMTSRAARLGGRLYIDTKPGKGVIISFTFRLPEK